MNGLLIGMGFGAVVGGIILLLMALRIESDWRTYVVLGTLCGLGSIWAFGR